jgi:hypothetical protein
MNKPTLLDENSFKKLKSWGLSHIRAFLYNIFGINQFFSGNGYTKDEFGN